MRLITDTIPALIAYFDAGEIYRYANKGYCEWFGKAPQELVGESIDRVIGVRAINSVREQIDIALGGEQVTYEYAMFRNGTKVHARTSLVPEFNPSGQVVGCFVLSFDITEQKRLQAALVQAQKMEAIGQLSSGIAHDFNNLLTIIIGNLGLLMGQIHERRDLKELVEPALDAGKRGAELVQRLLTFSRQQTLKSKIINVTDLIHNLTPLLKRSLPSHITLHLNLNAPNPFALIDSHQLENAVLNLVVNARDAMPQGGNITITSSEENIARASDETSDLTTGNYLQIAVTDTGIGMDAEVLSRIFEPFFTTKAFGQGSGLGLAMVYGFVKQSGGDISVESTPGEGTTFNILLPLQKAFEESGNQLQPKSTVRRQGQLVLLVEDLAEVRQIVRKQLIALGFKVLEADNAEMGLNIIQSVDEIGILLTDVVMPGNMNGRLLAQTAKHIKPALHIVIMSGYEDLTPADTDTAGQFAYLSKPFTTEQLADALCQP